MQVVQIDGFGYERGRVTICARIQQYHVHLDSADTVAVYERDIIVLIFQ